VAEDRSPVGRLFGAIVPRAVDAVDPDSLIDKVDIDALVQRVDLDALLERVDIDSLLTRIDVDGIVQRVDVDALMGRVDIDALMARVDIDALMARVDVDALMGRIDLDDLLGRVDIRALVLRAGIDEIVAEASTGVAARTLDLVRRQLVGLDVVLLGGVDRLLRRPRLALPAGELSATGRPAGPLSRLLGFLVDSFIVSTLFGIFVTLVGAMLDLFLASDVDLSEGTSVGWAAAFLTWWFLYLWLSLELAGRTVGKALVGLRVVSAPGGPLGPGRAALRTLVFPISFVLGLGFVPAVVRRDRRALHDLVAGSAEVVDWGDREARVPSALERWVERQHAEAAAEGLAAAGATPPSGS
jgi:uncharacterized RDD family membrane protein YckC